MDGPERCTTTTSHLLTSLSASGTTVPFGYTGLSQDERTSRAGTTFTSSATGLATESTGGALTSFVRDRQGTLIAMRTGSTRAYYLTDDLGSVVGLVNSGGAKVNSYSYDPYGVDRGKSEQVANPFEYTGGYLDDATGLYKFGIRYDDPTLGRFTQTDPTGIDEHDTYASNTPAVLTDLSGACGGVNASSRFFVGLSYSCGSFTIGIGPQVGVSGGTITIVSQGSSEGDNYFCGGGVFLSGIIGTTLGGDRPRRFAEVRAGITAGLGCSLNYTS